MIVSILCNQIYITPLLVLVYNVLFLFVYYSVCATIVTKHCVLSAIFSSPCNRGSIRTLMLCSIKGGPFQKNIWVQHQIYFHRSITTTVLVYIIHTLPVFVVILGNKITVCLLPLHYLSYVIAPVGSRLSGSYDRDYSLHFCVSGDTNNGIEFCVLSPLLIQC